MTRDENLYLTQAHFLSEIARYQKRTGTVSVTIGAVDNNIVTYGVITVTDAPGAVTSNLIDLADKLGVLYSVTSGGLRFNFHTAKELTREDVSK